MATDKKSICFIIPRFVTFSTGGAELQVHNLSQQFLKMDGTSSWYAAARTTKNR